MEFNIRAICAAYRGTASSEVVADYLGRELEFSAGNSRCIRFPSDIAAFQNIGANSEVLGTLADWVRLFRWFKDNVEYISVLSLRETEGGTVFYRLELIQPYRTRRQPRPPVQIINAVKMTEQECIKWLIDFNRRWRANPDQRNSVIQRPLLLKPSQVRVAIVESQRYPMPMALDAARSIAEVYGAEVILIPARDFRNTHSQIKAHLPLDAVLLIQHGNEHLSLDIVPREIDKGLDQVCSSSDEKALIEEIEIHIDLLVQNFDSRQAEQDPEDDQLLKLMLRGMFSHSKIGPNLHCPEEQVYTAVIAKKLNLARAKELLAENCESYQSTKASGKIFLWKAHNDGDQYFLNPARANELRDYLQGNGTLLTLP